MWCSARWNNLRVICDHHKKLGVALELTSNLPSNDIIERWLGEPIKTVILPTKLFLSDQKGRAVLPKAHQALVQRLFKVDMSALNDLICSGSGCLLTSLPFSHAARCSVHHPWCLPSPRRRHEDLPTTHLPPLGHSEATTIYQGIR